MGFKKRKVISQPYRKLQENSTTHPLLFRTFLYLHKDEGQNNYVEAAHLNGVKTCKSSYPNSICITMGWVISAENTSNLPRCANRKIFKELC